MKVGLFFGSFNPIHIGHLVLAEYFATQTDLDEVWLMVSPQNPLKSQNSLADQYARFDWAQRAVGDNPRIKVSQFEFKLPKPSYTIDTLTLLMAHYPKHEWVLIMGQDTVTSLPKWKNYERLLALVQVYVYPRLHNQNEHFTHFNLKTFNAPIVEISATTIRTAISAKQSVRYMIPDSIIDDVKSCQLYVNATKP